VICPHTNPKPKLADVTVGDTLTDREGRLWRVVDDTREWCRREGREGEASLLWLCVATGERRREHAGVSGEGVA
jgi:hypothetical protein